MAKKSKRRAWTTADVRMLKTAARKKTRASSIARTLKRTEGATRQKAFSLGLSLELASLIQFNQFNGQEAPFGAVGELVGIDGGVVSGVINLESSGVEASDWRPRHDERYHEA